MRTPLRRLAVLVDEPTDESFHWVLIEATGEYIETWIEVQQSDELFDTYHEAMAAGLLALQGAVEDLDVGPREAPPEATAPARRGGVFGGFGVMGR